MDTSAVVAILQGEPEAPEFAELIESANRLLISVATVLECSLVLGPARQRLLDDFLAIAGADQVAVDADQLGIARAAHLRFGRESGSPARLNFGDCFPYALAVARSEPLLFKGQDFGHTDVRPAIGP